MILLTKLMKTRWRKRGSRCLSIEFFRATNIDRGRIIWHTRLNWPTILSCLSAVNTGVTWNRLLKPLISWSKHQLMLMWVYHHGDLSWTPIPGTLRREQLRRFNTYCSWNNNIIAGICGSNIFGCLWYNSCIPKHHYILLAKSDCAWKFFRWTLHIWQFFLKLMRDCFLSFFLWTFLSRTWSDLIKFFHNLSSPCREHLSLLELAVIWWNRFWVFGVGRRLGEFSHAER